MNKEFAKYIKELQSASESTHRAEDRKLYETYLAEAGYILSEMTLGASEERIIDLIKNHDRLWGNTWLQDPVFKKSADLYQSFKARHAPNI